MVYDARNWYWNVTGLSQIWSSESMTFVERTNGTYTDWAITNHATTIGNVDDLMLVMQAQVQPSIMAHGVILKTPAKLAGTYAVTDAAHNAMTILATSIAAGRPLPGGGTSFNYADSAGVQHSFTGPQFLSLAHACDNYIYGWTQALASNLASKGGNYPSRTITLAT